MKILLSSTNDTNDTNDKNNFKNKLDNLLGKNVNSDILNKNIFGSIIFFVVVICFIPFILYKFKLFDILEVYFPNVDLIATSLSFNNGPFNSNIFKYLYLDGTPLIGYINQNIIAYIALMSVMYIVIRSAVVNKNIFVGLSKASIICFTTYLLPNRWIIAGMTIFEHMIKKFMSGPYIWFICLLCGLIISYFCIFCEAKLIKYFSPLISKYMEKIIGVTIKKKSNEHAIERMIKN